MLDLGKFTDMFTSLAGGAAQGEQADILQRLADLGVDPALLQDLDTARLTAALEQHGIDLGQLGPDQIGEVLGQLGVLPATFSGHGELLANVTDWLGGRGREA